MFSARYLSFFGEFFVDCIFMRNANALNNTIVSIFRKIPQSSCQRNEWELTPVIINRTKWGLAECKKLF